MMTSASLNRVGHHYRKGYEDGATGLNVLRGTPAHTFASHDYHAGVRAGLNDRLWEAFHRGEIIVSWLPDYRR